MCFPWVFTEESVPCRQALIFPSLYDVRNVIKCSRSAAQPPSSHFNSHQSHMPYCRLSSPNKTEWQTQQNTPAVKCVVIMLRDHSRKICRWLMDVSNLTVAVVPRCNIPSFLSSHACDVLLPMLIQGSWGLGMNCCMYVSMAAASLTKRQSSFSAYIIYIQLCSLFLFKEMLCDTN